MSLSKLDLYEVMEVALRPVLREVKRAISVIPITGKGKENYVPQLEKGEIGNYREVASKVIDLCVYGVDRNYSDVTLIANVINILKNSLFSIISLDREPLIDKLTEICIYCIDMEGDTGLQTSPIYMRDNIKRAVDKWDSRVSTVPTIPDADHYMQEIRRYLQHYDNKEMSAASLINVFAKEINRYFE